MYADISILTDFLDLIKRVGGMIILQKNAITPPQKSGNRLNHTQRLDKHVEQLSQTFKALAEPVRLRILNLLINQESLCVCDLVSVLELGQSTVSRHLAYLKNAGLVHSWRDGTWMHYAIDPKSLTVLNLDVLKEQFKQAPQLSTDIQRLESYQCSPRTCQA